MPRAGTPSHRLPFEKNTPLEKTKQKNFGTIRQIRANGHHRQDCKKKKGTNFRWDIFMSLWLH